MTNYFVAYGLVLLIMILSEGIGYNTAGMSLTVWNIVLEIHYDGQSEWQNAYKSFD